MGGGKRGGLFVAAEGRGQKRASQGPVRVVHHAPIGETDGQIEIALAFDRPMVELSTLRDAGGVVSIEPAVPLSVRWLGSQTLLARPSAPLPMATRFRVRLSPTIKALDGKGLEAPFEYEFQTPPPRVEQSEPYQGADHELPSRAIDLAFNQRVTPGQVKAHAVLSVVTEDGATRTLKFEVTSPDANDPKRVRIKSTGDLPLAAEVRLRIGPELTGDEGARSMGEPYLLTFRTFGPLKLASLDACDGRPCSPSGGGALRFTNPVSLAVVRKAMKFEPPLPKPLAVSDEDYTSEYVYLGADFAPSTAYKITLEGEIKDVFGNLLEGDRVVKLRTGPYEPYVYFPIDGDIVPADSKAILPLRVRNIKELSVGFVALKAEEVEPMVSGRTWLPSQPLTMQPLKGAGPRESRLLKVDASSALVNGKGVIMAFATRKPGDPNALSARSVLAYTDLAPTLKTWPKGGMVWVNQLSTNAPVVGARVSIVDCGKKLASGVTDTSGSFRFARKDSDEECDTFAVVEKDGDLSFTRKYAGHGPWDLTTNTSYSGGGAAEGYLFTERGLYRPGERMRVKGVLQARGDKGLSPAKGKTSLVITDSQGREIDKAELTLTAFGTFSHEVRIPGSVPLGTVGIMATFGNQMFDAAVEVAEYRRAELEAKVESERPEYVRGDVAQVNVHAQYLFGAPVSNQRVIWSARRTERSLTPIGERYEGFTFGDETRWYEDVTPAEETALGGGESKLDAKGDLALRIPLELAVEAGSTGVEVEATVEGLGGVTTSARHVLTVTPASFMLGVKTSSYLVQSGAPFDAQVVAAKLGGAAIPGVATSLSLTRRVYKSELTKGDAGEAVMRYTHTDETIAGCSLKTEKALVRCSMTPTAAGLHFLRARARDEKGRSVTAALPVYVYGPGEATWAQGDTKVLSLKSNKKTYRIGETAQILVPSPFAEADALVTVERDGVLSVERQHLSGGAPTLSIPIDERFVPNGFVSVLLMQKARKPTATDDGRPDYRIGAIELATDVSRRHLRVEVKPDATEKQPGEEVSVALQVKDGAGKPVPAELTVFAVDEGVLLLSGYQTPDPFARMYAPQGLTVWTSDVRARLANPSSGEDDKGGSGAGGGGAVIRRDFEAVAFYAPEVLTDEKGRAQVKFRLPDSLTRYRIMAVAISQHAELGSGDAGVRTHKPLMVRPMLPRVIRVGDVLEAGASLQTESEKPIEVRVVAEVSGLTVQGSKEKVLKVSKKAPAELRFKLRAEQAGQAKLRVHASSGVLEDAFELEKTVLLPTPLETVSTTGMTDGKITEALGTISELRGDAGGLELTASTSALGGLEAPLDALIDYAYGCTEQLSSRLIGLTARARLQKLGVLEGKDLQPAIEKVLVAIERRQRGDGSYALWDEDYGQRWPELDAFVTGYALFALHEAKVAGFAPAATAMESSRGWLSAYLRSEGAKARLGDADRVFAMYALARVGFADASYAATFVERAPSLPLISRVELAHTLWLASDKASVAKLAEDLVDRLRITADEAHLEENLGDGYEAIMVSDVRATAELVQLLSAMDKDHAMLPRLARWLSNARGLNGHWGSTQQNAWGLLALSSYLEQVEGVPPNLSALIKVDGEARLRADLAGRKARAQTFTAMADLPQNGAEVEVERQGQGRLHYNLRLSYAKRELPKTPLEQGFFVEREYERVDPAQLAQGKREGTVASRANVGDYVRVTLRIAVPAGRRFVVIEDPVPAGLEPMSFGLSTESQAAALALGLDHGPSDHMELRDDKVVFAVTDLSPGLYRYTYLTRAITTGQFVAPPARAEEMYHPETFGRTAVGYFDVVER